ncbi:gephyrin-like molybdotransferase Glp [Planctomycetota bacterium]
MANIDPKKALQCVLEQVTPLPAEQVDLTEALGRTLARDLKADRDSPPTHRSTMDGYAVRAADLAQPQGRLRLIGEVAAGASIFPEVQAGTCVRIFTGAVVPPGADTVVMVEETREEGEDVLFAEVAQAGKHIRLCGEEYQKGSVLLSPGTVLGPAQIGLCAAVGKAKVWVFRQPRVAVLSTGSELVHAGEKVEPWQLCNSNGPMLRAAVLQAGALCVEQREVVDEEDKLTDALKAVSAHADVVLLSGGVSVGRYDLVPQAIKRLRATIHFHGVNIIPGKPILFATRGYRCGFFGLPGNPVSALTGFYEFVLPALRRLSGCPLATCQATWQLPLGQPLKKLKSHTLCALVQLDTDTGKPTLMDVASRGSAHLAAAAQAQGVAILPPGTEAEEVGSMVTYHPWRALW